MSATALPHDAFPHLVDLIFAAAPALSLLSLRAASRSWRERADRLLVQHVRFDGETFLIPSPAPTNSTSSSSSPARSPSPTSSPSPSSIRVPVADWLNLPLLTSAVRILDITPLPPGVASQPVHLGAASRFRLLHTARIGRVLDYWEHGLFEVERVVLPSPWTHNPGEGLRGGHFDFLRKQVRRRIVVHVPPRWPERLFHDLGVMLKFGRASELVLVFPDGAKVEQAPEVDEEGGGGGGGGGHDQGPAVARGGEDADGLLNAEGDTLAAVDVMWPHFARGRLQRIDIVNTGRGVADWPRPSPKATASSCTEDGGTAPELVQTCRCLSRHITEWRVWRRFEQQGHRAPDEVQHWTREEVMDRAHALLRFMSLDEYRLDRGEEAYRVEMGM